MMNEYGYDGTEALLRLVLDLALKGRHQVSSRILKHVQRHKCNAR
jgi:hypothetical protein